MNDEIKEILEEFLKEKGAYSLRYSFNGDLAYSQEQILKDYITNLQKENERLKELYNEEIHKRIKAHKYIFKNMICDALYPASKVDGENVINILNKGDYK